MKINFFNKNLFFINGILLALLLVHSMYRDFQLERQFPMDLRNRVVGSRLQKDGKLPYNYYWQPTDGIRYYDIRNLNKDDHGISNITASPFFNELLYPICDLPQRLISGIWLGLQYFFLFIMIALFYSLANIKWKKWLIINMGILFTATEAWKVLIQYGQLYFFEAFLMAFILFMLIRNTKWTDIIAGILAACFVLTRPIAIVMFIPFLFYFRKNTIFLATAFAGLAVYGMFVLLNPHEQSLYKNYFSSLRKQVLIHIKDNPELIQVIDPNSLPFKNMEGFDLLEVEGYKKKYPIICFTEYGNVFVLYNKITKTKMSLLMLSAGLAITFLVVTGLFFYFSRKHPTQNIQVFLTGFLLYMIVELFSPVHRPQYNTVEWFPLVFAGILLLKEWRTAACLLLILGLLLSISNAHRILMRHTLGEFVWLAALLLLAFQYLPDENKSITAS